MIGVLLQAFIVTAAVVLYVLWLVVLKAVGVGWLTFWFVALTAPVFGLVLIARTLLLRWRLKRWPERVEVSPRWTARREARRALRAL